jgi:hypothetical protein
MQNVRIMAWSTIHMFHLQAYWTDFDKIPLLGMTPKVVSQISFRFLSVAYTPDVFEI